MVDFPLIPPNEPWTNKVIQLINNALKKIGTGGGSLSDADYGDITVSGSGTVMTIDNDVVTNAKLRNSGALSVIGRSANSSGDPADISASAASDAVLRESGSTLGFGTVATGGIANNAVTYAKVQDVSATSRIIGRKTSGAGDPEECTLSEILDFIGSAAQGDILYRDASGWARLGAGTSGNVLKTQGTGANPTWGTVPGASGGGWVLLASSVASNSVQIDLTLSTTYDHYMIIINDLVPVTDNTSLFCRVSTNNGSSYDSGASDYKWALGGNSTNSATFSGASDTGDPQITINTAFGNDTGESGNIVINLDNVNGSKYKTLYGHLGYNRADGHFGNTMFAGTRLTTSALTNIRFFMSSGNISSGNFYLYGIAKA